MASSGWVSVREGWCVRRVGSCDRRRLEHLSRYFLRPALATERLELLEDGLYPYELKRL